MSIWLYHLNPRRDWEYGWDYDNPRELVERSESIWPARQNIRKMAKGDMICVFMKNLIGQPDGVYVVGKITDVDILENDFEWQPDKKLSRQLVDRPIPAETVRRFFGRSYGNTIQGLPPNQERDWLKILQAPRPTANETVALEGEAIFTEVKRRERNPALKEACLRRDRYQCRYCGFPTESLRDDIGNKAIVHVHHVYPMKDVEGVTAITLKDLLTLCPTCHAVIHAVADARGIRKLDINVLKRFYPLR